VIRTRTAAARPAPTVAAEGTPFRASARATHRAAGSTRGPSGAVNDAASRSCRTARAAADARTSTHRSDVVAPTRTSTAPATPPPWNPKTHVSRSLG
jgi:hypothetical protein